MLIIKRLVLFSNFFFIWRGGVPVYFLVVLVIMFIYLFIYLSLVSTNQPLCQKNGRAQVPLNKLSQICIYKYLILSKYTQKFDSKLLYHRKNRMQFYLKIRVWLFIDKTKTKSKYSEHNRTLLVGFGFDDCCNRILVFRCK